MTTSSNEPSSLCSLTYVSSAIELFSATDLRDLLQTCRRNNTTAGVTGMLLYKDGNFMQVLEGEEETVRRIHLKIGRDPRHDGLITLLDTKITHRDFGEWSMGFADLTDPSIHTVSGYSEFLNTPLMSTQFVDQPSRATKLLATFKQKM